MTEADKVQRIEEYASKKGLTVGRRLGFGVHGSVFDAESQGGAVSAIKVHEREASYRIERDVYRRLEWNRVVEIFGFNVPLLIDYDDDLWVIEMTIANRPFVLDFAGVCLDEAPLERDDMLAQLRETSDEHFGRRWPTVEGIILYLEKFGIYLIDINAKNISFGE